MVRVQEIAPLSPRCSREEEEAVEVHVIKMQPLTEGEVGVTVKIQAAADQQPVQPSTESCCVCFQWPVLQTGWCGLPVEANPNPTPNPNPNPNANPTLTLTRCGLPVEERPDLSTIWDRAEVYSLAIPAFFFCLGLVFTTSYFAVDEATQSTLSWMRPPDMATFTTLLTTFAATGLLLLLGMYPIGLLAWYGGVSVAITRKITHVIFISLLPLTVIFLNEQGEGLARDMFLAMVWQSLSSTLLLAIMFSKASRKYVPVLRVAFAGIERSEDRPHALTWFSLQMVGQTMVQIPMIQWMQSNDKGLLIWIPFLSVGLGDGLAEPVGRCAPSPSNTL